MSSGFEWSDDGLLRCCALDQFSWQTHAFGSRVKNPTGAATQRQVHSSIVTDLAERTDQSQGDALITNREGASVGVRTADCVPILLIDAHGRSIGAIHAGWRGTAARIAEETLNAMRRRFGAQPSNVHAAIGPCIGPCCYQVGREVAEQFREWMDAREDLHLDLAQANARQLESMGVPGHQIFSAGLCTFCQHDRFFSYRRDRSETGRMISAISLLA